MSDRYYDRSRSRERNGRSQGRERHNRSRSRGKYRSGSAITERKDSEYRNEKKNHYSDQSKYNNGYERIVTDYDDNDPVNRRGRNRKDDHTDSYHHRTERNEFDQLRRNNSNQFDRRRQRSVSQERETRERKTLAVVHTSERFRDRSIDRRNRKEIDKESKNNYQGATSNNYKKKYEYEQMRKLEVVDPRKIIIEGKKENASDNADDVSHMQTESTIMPPYDDPVEESELKKLELLLSSENGDDDINFGMINPDKEAERLAAERRRRLQEISQKYQQPSSIASSDNKLQNAVEPEHDQVDRHSIFRRNTNASDGSTVSLMDISVHYSNLLPINEQQLSELEDGSRYNAQEMSLMMKSPNATAKHIAFEDLVLEEGQSLRSNPLNGRESPHSIAASNSTALLRPFPPNQPIRFQPLVQDETADEAKNLRDEKHALEAEQDNLKLSFDMFSASPSLMEQEQQQKLRHNHDLNLPHKAGKGQPSDPSNKGRKALRKALVEGENPHLQSNWDDGEGYYQARIGEVISITGGYDAGNSYQILGIVGKGVFSTVLKCVDVRKAKEIANSSTSLTPSISSQEKEKAYVAVKMIRNNDTMKKAAEKEKTILQMIAGRDPDNKRHCVRLLSHMEYRNHVALVFEYQQMNLREALKKFGKDVGINVGAVRMYGKQLFSALRLLQDLRVVHADIKLDNILCSGDLRQVKLCDFGSAFFETDTDNDPTPYLVSRFYRAPEIILGMNYDRSIDLWSVCVCLYELFTGHVMFPGRTNNEMLRLMMSVKGRLPNKLARNHIRSYETMGLEPHFDNELRFRQYEVDPVTGKVVLRLVEINQPTKDLQRILRSSKAGADDMKLVVALTDLLDKGLSLDPSKRLPVLEALRHPFITGSGSISSNPSTNPENTSSSQKIANDPKIDGTQKNNSKQNTQ